MIWVLHRNYYKLKLLTSQEDSYIKSNSQFSDCLNVIKHLDNWDDLFFFHAFFDTYLFLSCFNNSCIKNIHLLQAKTFQPCIFFELYRPFSFLLKINEAVFNFLKIHQNSSAFAALFNFCSGSVLFNNFSFGFFLISFAFSVMSFCSF